MKHALLACWLVLVIAAPNVHAEEFKLLDPKVRIASHQTRPSRTTLGTGFIEVLRTEPSSFPAGAGTYDILPECTARTVSRDEVYSNTYGTDLLDIVYYDGQENDQSAKAERWPGVAVPFLQGAAANPYVSTDRIQWFARIIGLRCLPTRFHFVNVESKRYIELREGDAAWEQ